MPVIFNEPLSFLQRLAEYMEHTKLIHQANATTDSVERMKVPQCLCLLLNKRKGWRLIFLHDDKTLLLTCHVVRRSVCCVSCCITVGEDWETFQPATGRDLRAYQVKQCCQHQTHEPDADCGISCHIKCVTVLFYCWFFYQRGFGI